VADEEKKTLSADPSSVERGGVSASKKEANGGLNFNAVQLAWELGYSIAIPIVLLALAGRWADKQFETSPWFLLIGIVVSIVISSFLVYRKTKNILKE